MISLTIQSVGDHVSMLSESSILCNNSNHPILERLSIRLGVGVLMDHWRGGWVLL